MKIFNANWLKFQVMQVGIIVNSLKNMIYLINTQFIFQFAYNHWTGEIGEMLKIENLELLNSLGRLSEEQQEMSQNCTKVSPFQSSTLKKIISNNKSQNS